MKYKLTLIILTVIALASCRQYKDIVMFQDLENMEQQEAKPVKTTYLLKAGDILYINIVTFDKEIAELFSTNSNMQNSSYAMNSNTGLYITGYDIDSEGNLTLPVVGKVNVADKKVETAKMNIQDAIKKYSTDATVTVKLINTRITVIGEVARPGVFYNYNNELTVLDAISMAGDINEYGNLRKVIVIRKQGNKSTSYRVDLTSKKLLVSEGYYLQPNDVVYVEPDRWKNIKINIPTYSIILSTVTTLMVVLQYMK